MDNMYSEKEVLADGLAAAKAATNNYNTFANEAACESVRDTVLKLLADEHSIQFDVFKMMNAKGLYPTPKAEEKKVEQTKSKFAAARG